MFIKKLIKHHLIVSILFKKILPNITNADIKIFSLFFFTYFHLQMAVLPTFNYFVCFFS